MRCDAAAGGHHNQGGLTGCGGLGLDAGDALFDRGNFSGDFRFQAEDRAQALLGGLEGGNQVGLIDGLVDGRGNLAQGGQLGSRARGDEDHVGLQLVDQFKVGLKERANVGILVAGVLGEVRR